MSISKVLVLICFAFSPVNYGFGGDGFEVDLLKVGERVKIVLLNGNIIRHATIDSVVMGFTKVWVKGEFVIGDQTEVDTREIKIAAIDVNRSFFYDRNVATKSKANNRRLHRKYLHLIELFTKIRSILSNSPDEIDFINISAILAANGILPDMLNGADFEMESEISASAVALQNIKLFLGQIALSIELGNEKYIKLASTASVAHDVLDSCQILLLNRSKRRLKGKRK